MDDSIARQSRARSAECDHILDSLHDELLHDDSLHDAVIVRIAV